MTFSLDDVPLVEREIMSCEDVLSNINFRLMEEAIGCPKVDEQSLFSQTRHEYACTQALHRDMRMQRLLERAIHERAKVCVLSRLLIVKFDDDDKYDGAKRVRKGQQRRPVGGKSLQKQRRHHLPRGK
jgi:hypothetical protein